MRFWLGWQDSNLRMTGSKPVALPLGDTPKRSLFLSKGPVNLKPNFVKMPPAEGGVTRRLEAVWPGSTSRDGGR